MSATATETPDETEGELEPDANETGDAEPDDGDATEPDVAAEQAAEAQQPESSAMIEEIGKKLDKLNQHVAKRMGEILGEDAQLYRECMCNLFFQTPGWLPPIDPTADAQAFMLHWMGQRAASDLKRDKYSRTCDTCGGEGIVATGASRSAQPELPCLDCGAKGWIPVGPERATTGGYTAPTAPATAPANGAAQVPAAQPDSPEVAALKQAGYTVIPPFPG